MKTIDIQSVQTLEQYLFHMGVLCVSVNTLSELQKIATKRGLLGDDAMENAKTIEFEIMRLLTTINDQLDLVASRTNTDWKTLVKNFVLESKKV